MTASVGPTHIITAEFPPLVGGVSDHAYQIATGLAAAGIEVHVWCRPSTDGLPPNPPGAAVHREAGSFTRSDLRSLGLRLDSFPAPRRLLVQWVPHSYGYRSLNLFFCRWLQQRARKGDRVEIMVHEPWLPFSLAHPSWNVPALIHRVMTVSLLRAASRIWVSAPEWERRWRSYRFGRDVPFDWLPLPNGIPILHDERAVGELRATLAFGEGPVVGYFGLTSGDTAEILDKWIARLLDRHPTASILLIGKGGAEFRASFVADHPRAASRVHATGSLSKEQVSLHLQLCDLMVQPFLGGVNARRSSMVTVMAHGLASVTTSGRFTESFWRESQAVDLVPDDAPDQAADRIQTLLDDPASRAGLEQRAHKLYDSQFDLRRAVALLTGASLLDPPVRQAYLEARQEDQHLA